MRRTDLKTSWFVTIKVKTGLIKLRPRRIRHDDKANDANDKNVVSKRTKRAAT